MLDKLPPISGSASKLLGSLGKREVEVKDVTVAIERDPVLAARVLEIANSGAFGRMRAIHSINHAVALIGRPSLRRFALSWTIGSVFRRMALSADFSLTRFTMHSDAVATLADLLAEHVPVRNGDAAYVAGLIHDVGLLVMHTAGSDRLLEQILLLHRLNTGTILDCEREALGVDHAELSAMAAKKWQLDDVICEAIHFHHTPEKDPSLRNGVIPLSLALNKVDGFIDSLGLSIAQGLDYGEAVLELPGHDGGVRKAIQSFQAAFEIHNPAAAAAR